MNKRKIHKVLIANRGEPVRRAIKTFQKIGIKSVTIAISDDLSADWIAESDECSEVGSYLNADEIALAAKKAGCDGVWPGWGFLSENADFAKAVIENDLVWLGPSRDVISTMGSKSEATEIAKKAGLKTIPEISLQPKEAPQETYKELKEAAKEIGMPLLLKPALGGGGKGQAIIHDENEIEASWNQVFQINKNLFKSGPIIVQRFFTQARHIETQILADNYGSVVVLGERECTVQRRNQKVIEESPSPALTDDQRAALIESSASFAHSVGYSSAGTIEFLYSEGDFYFLEMNTRLQVEHPVTEETTRILKEGKECRVDLIQEMVLVAQGERLSFNQSQVLRKGHAIEARIYAEDPEKDFQPAPGTIASYSFPQDEGLRCDAAFSSAPFTVSPHFDSMIAKVIAWDDNREKTISKLSHALQKVVILGLTTNTGLCKRVLSHEDFKQGQYYTNLLAQNPQLQCEQIESPGLWFAVGTAIEYHQYLAQIRETLKSTQPTSLQHILSKIPQNSVCYEAHMQHQQAQLTVEERSEGNFCVSSANWEFCLKIIQRNENEFSIILPDGQLISVRTHSADKFKRHLCMQGRSFYLDVFPSGQTLKLDPHASPMTGMIVDVCVSVGDKVKKGQELYQIEAMKMMTSIKATHDGVIEEVLKNASDVAKSGESVLTLSSEESLQDDQVIENGNLGYSLKQSEVSELDDIKNYFLGYDVAHEWVDQCIDKVSQKIKTKQIKGNDFALMVSTILKARQELKDMFSNNEHILTFLAEQEDQASDLIPYAEKASLEELFQNYGVGSLSDLDKNPKTLIRFFQAFKNDSKVKKEKMIRLLTLCQSTGSCHQNLTSPLVSWLKTKPILSEIEKNDIWALLYLLSPEKYYEIGKLPVALEFLQEYRMVKRNPAYDFDLGEYDRLKQELDSGNECQSLEFEDFPGYLKPYLKKWFQHFVGRKLVLPKAIANKDVHLFELFPAQNPSKDNTIPPRFIALSLVSQAELKMTSLGTATLPHFEEGAVMAYRALRLVQRGKPHRPNNVLLLSKDAAPIPWNGNHTHDQELSLSTETVKQISSRVGGFAEGLQIQSTEVILPLITEAQSEPVWTVVEVRHDQNKNVISRPPFSIEERDSLKPQDKESQMSEKQQRMGKLLNQDRAKLLFDNGDYNELFFPEVDDKPNVALNVYQGHVNNVPVLAYAGDFRYRGGALGENEGKKLAAAVVLAYLMNKPLVAFHDGAGANIKESVASLGWAGAYFGALAHTGGFSTPDKFRTWFKNHLGREYFEKVLRHFDLSRSIDEIIDGVSRQLIHFHLHVGATVGMLVYGASIGHLSLMNDQPECYRVLTGAQTVRKVLGEKGTNYSLGGAKAHAERSGDIEFVFPSEEKVINATRQLLKLFSVIERKEEIERDQSLPLLDVPIKSGIVFGRDVLKAHVDQGEFFETRPDLKQAKNILTGYAKIAGFPAAMIVTATDYGLYNANSFKKVTGLVEAAQDINIPLVLACGDQWEAPSLPVSKEHLEGRQGFYHALLNVNVPKISLALGARSLEQPIHQHMDYCLYVKRGDETESEINRAMSFCPFVCENLTEAFDQIARLMPFSKNEAPSMTTLGGSHEGKSDFNLPQDLTQSYEMRNVIEATFDNGSFKEYWKDDQLPLIVGVAKLGGVKVGVIADNPAIESGAQNVDSITKFTRMNRLCERFNLPLIELNDSPAFKPGSEQEHRGIQGVGGRSIREECLSRNPKIAVTLRQNYGGRFIHANLITLGPPRAGLVLKKARIGVMGAKGAVGVLYAKKLTALPLAERQEAEKQWQKEYEDKQLSPEKAVELGYAKEIIDSAHLRVKLCETLQSLMREGN